jgi:hypothetical protein
LVWCLTTVADVGRANNNLFLPGDAFFPTTLSADDVARLKADAQTPHPAREFAPARTPHTRKMRPRIRPTRNTRTQTAFRAGGDVAVRGRAWASSAEQE